MLKHQLMALQANCASTVQNIQSIIAMIDQDVEEHKSAQVNSECQHPHQFLQKNINLHKLIANASIHISFYKTYVPWEILIDSFALNVNKK